MSESCVYKVKTTSPAVQFTPIPSVSRVDQFESATASVQKRKDLCPPANKNGEGIHDA